MGQHRKTGLSECAAKMDIGVIDGHDAIKATDQASKILEVFQVAPREADQLIGSGRIEGCNLGFDIAMLQADKIAVFAIKQRCQVLKRHRAVCPIGMQRAAPP